MHNGAQWWFQLNANVSMLTLGNGFDHKTVMETEYHLAIGALEKKSGAFVKSLSFIFWLPGMSAL